MKSAYMTADDFCEGRYTLKGGYAFTVDELEALLNAFADERIEEAAKIVFENYWSARAFNEPAEIWLGELVRSLKSSGPGER